MVLDLEGGRMVPRKWWVSENFGSISKYPKQFVWGSKYRFRVIFASRSLDFFLPMGLVVSDLSFFLNSVWSSGVAFFQSLWVQLMELYPGSRGPFSKYLMWNKPCEADLWSHKQATSFPCEKSVQNLNWVVDWLPLRPQEINAVTVNLIGCIEELHRVRLKTGCNCNVHNKQYNHGL